MNNVRIALTTGDIDGIGFEVAAKALYKIGPQKNVQILLWRSEGASEKYLALIDKKWPRITVDSLEEALKIKGPYLIDIASDLSPAKWVELSAMACLNKKIHALATAPLSKTSIKEAGFKDLGHTDILKRLSKTQYVNMGFVGNKFNVVLATAHEPLSKVTKTLNLQVLQEALLNANELRKRLPGTQKPKPIGILGLNPHAGERGLIGHEETELFPKILAFAHKKKIPVEGPLVPDAAFFPTSWKRFSLYLALYHDQGLIPFKMIHGQDSGVHISLGIPFVRTSVDHGTAKDIFGKNKANPQSMIDALRWAIKLARL
ncbi:MAG: 4-hydroxythreonine-4-phosphate dehydrogenase PdxA [Bdellovibrio sp.]|nr:4-hydroxythreonine-4-phosphate dehydrogenase PdxA [Bdellovibrio sp.]